MTEIREGALSFTFATDEATQYDHWSFYRNQFQKVCEGTKAVDILYLDGNDLCWLIEVKDYSVHPRTKPSELGAEVARKVRDTLAGLAAAQANANDRDERRLACKALRCRWRVVLHLEQPTTPARLRPQIVDPAHLKMKLKQLIKAIDPHPDVVDRHHLSPQMDWTVTG